VPPTFEEIAAKVAPLLEPVPGPSPAGSPARLDAGYEAVAAEIAKLDAPSGAAVDWRAVARGASEILRSRSKDLAMAAFLARALQASDGVAGLATGEALLVGLMERYWDTMQPDVKRLRGRANAIQWLLERALLGLGADQAPAPGLADVEALEVASKRLADLAREKLAHATPAFGPLLEAVEQLKLAAAARGAPAAAGPAPTASPQAAGSPGAPPPTAPELPALGASADAAAFLEKVGDALVDSARKLREASSADAAAYRILRVGLWMHLAQSPPSSAGRTYIPAPPDALRGRLELLAQNQQWAALLDEAESVLPSHRFALDLHRLVWQALGGLGPSHERARAAVVSEVRTLLERMPELDGLAFANGTPMASPPTRSWIDMVVRAPAGGAPASTSEGGPTSRARPSASEAQKLLADGRAAEGLSRFQEAIAAALTGRERFLLRLELAQACTAAGLAAVAKGAYEELDREAQAHALADWEPRLAVETLKGLIAAARALGKDPRGGTAPLVDHYQRLCRLDPAAAHEIWP
jgi:type VI secretion system protein VasJ